MPDLPWSSDTVGIERLVAVTFGDTKQAKQMDPESESYFAQRKKMKRIITLINLLSSEKTMRRRRSHVHIWNRLEAVLMLYDFWLFGLIVCFTGVLVSLKGLPLRAKEASILVEQKGKSKPTQDVERRSIAKNAVKMLVVKSKRLKGCQYRYHQRKRG